MFEMMSKRRTRIAKAQKLVEPVRSRNRNQSCNMSRVPVQAVAPQAAYRPRPGQSQRTDAGGSPDDAAHGG